MYATSAHATIPSPKCQASKSPDMNVQKAKNMIKVTRKLTIVKIPPNNGSNAVLPSHSLTCQVKIGPAGPTRKNCATLGEYMLYSPKA